MLHAPRGIPRKYIDAAFVIGFVAALWFLLWRVPFGFANSDEAFYLSVPYRLTMGDALLVDEWHVSQLAGFLLYPVMRLYMQIAKGTDGILLAFRYIYIFAQSMATVYIYLRLRRVSGGGAVLASLAFFLYAPFNISALSYNSMGIMLISAACVTAGTLSKHRRRDMLLAGLLFAAAVLCCPHLLLMFFIYLILTLVRLINVKRGAAARDDLLSGEAFLPFMIGASLLALIFAIFALSRADISAIVEALKHIMNDPEHPSIPVYQALFTYVSSFFVIHKLAPSVLCGSGILLVLTVKDKKRGEHRRLYLLAASILTALFYIPFIFDGAFPLSYAPGQPITRSVNLLMLPLNILGLFAYILSEKRQKALFWGIYIPGILYSLCIHLSSNQRMINIASASAVALLASIIFIYQMIEELLAQEHGLRFTAVTALALSALLALQLSTEIFFRHSFAFWEDSCPEGLTELINEGPEKGILSSYGYAYIYNELYEATEPLRLIPEGRVLYLTGQTWLYLADGKENGAYSAWLSYANAQASVQRLFEYWQIDPSRKPDYIFVGADFPEAEKYKDLLNTYSQPAIETTRGYILGITN